MWYEKYLIEWYKKEVENELEIDKLKEVRK